MAVSTDRRWCPKCEKVYEATIVTERTGGEMSSRTVSPCPDCGTDGQLLVDVPPDVRFR
jgi:RNase P subunit RPR2